MAQRHRNKERLLHSGGLTMVPTFQGVQLYDATLLHVGPWLTLHCVSPFLPVSTLFVPSLRLTAFVEKCSIRMAEVS